MVNMRILCFIISIVFLTNSFTLIGYENNTHVTRQNGIYNTIADSNDNEGQYLNRVILAKNLNETIKTKYKESDDIFEAIKNSCQVAKEETNIISFINKENKIELLSYPIQFLTDIILALRLSGVSFCQVMVIFENTFIIAKDKPSCDYLLSLLDIKNKGYLTISKAVQIENETKNLSIYKMKEYCDTNDILMLSEYDSWLHHDLDYYVLIYENSDEYAIVYPYIEPFSNEFLKKMDNTTITYFNNMTIVSTNVLSQELINFSKIN